jgi:RNA polymerase sigma-70 factor (ECF subfamily)
VFLRGAERARKHDDIVTREAGPDPGAISRAVPVWTREFGKDPEAGFFDSFVDREILEAIDSLPEDYREAVVLSDMEGLGYREIADMVGAPIGTVKSRLFRGRRMLQDKLFEYAVGMGYVRPPREESGG